MASTVLATSAATMSLTFMRTSWKSPFLRPAPGAMMSTKMLPTDEPVWLATFNPLSSLDLADVEVLAGDDLGGLADIFDHGDRDQPALVVSDGERLARIGAHVDLARHHLLHGEVARRHRELLELDAALFQHARLEQVIGRHPPDIGLVALPDGRERGLRARNSQACRQRAGAGRGQIVSTGHSKLLRHGRCPPLEGCE